MHRYLVEKHFAALKANLKEFHVENEYAEEKTSLFEL